MNDVVKIKILNKEVSLKRLKLKEWTRLEPLKRNLDAALQNKTFDTVSNLMAGFIEAVMEQPAPKIAWDKLAWWEFLEVYTEAVQLNNPTIQFPILQTRGEDKKLPWEYEGRAWYFWLNLFASNYGWDEATIAELDIDTAIGAYQEIEITNQLEKEWEWGMSEIAYPYNKNTKKSEYHPLQRPEWMRPVIPKQLPVVKIRQEFVPQGNVIDLSALSKKND